MNGMRHIQRAREELRATGDPRGRLRAAAREFWRAVFDMDTWPPRLQEHAKRILPHLFRGGVIDDTVRNASDGTISSLSDEIRAFCDEAEDLDPPASQN